MIALNLLWVLDAPAWQKLFFVTMAAGVSTFIYILESWVIPEGIEGLKSWKKSLPSFWKKSLAEHHAFIAGMRKGKALSLTLIMILCSFTLVSHAKAGNTYEYAETKLLRPTGDYSVVKSAWTTSPADYIYYTKVQTNDGDTTYVRCNNSGAWSVLAFNITTFVDNATLTNESYDVSIWVIAKCQFAGVGRLMISIRNDVANFYDSSLIVRRVSASASYVNYTAKTNGCPWTGANWTITNINQMYVVLWTNGLGTFTITDIGIIVRTIVPFEEPEDNSNGIILLFVAMMVITGILFIAYSKE